MHWEPLRGQGLSRSHPPPHSKVGHLKLAVLTLGPGNAVTGDEAHVVDEGMEPQIRGVHPVTRLGVLIQLASSTRPTLSVDLPVGHLSSGERPEEGVLVHEGELGMAFCLRENILCGWAIVN